MKISAYQSALLVALIFNRSGLKRARLTSKTLCNISGRVSLRSHFIVQLQAELDDLGLILFESGRGFGLIRYSLLNGAMVLSESSHIADELADIKDDAEYDFLITYKIPPRLTIRTILYLGLFKMMENGHVKESNTVPKGLQFNGVIPRLRHGRTMHESII